MINTLQNCILLFGNDNHSDNIFKIQLEKCNYFVDYVSSEQDFIKIILRKDNEIDLVIISKICTTDKEVISDNILSNINIPLIVFEKPINKDNFLLNINDNIKNAIEVYKQRQEINDNKQLTEGRIDSCALHEIICDNDGKVINYKFIDADQIFLKNIHKTKEEIIGKTVLDLFPKTELIWIETFGRVALSGKPEVLTHYSVELGNIYEARAYSPEKGRFFAVFINLNKAKGKYICKKD